MRARARLFETLQDLLGAFHHPVEGLGNHGKCADRMPLGNAMVRHGVPFGTEMPTAVFVPTSIPNFHGAFSLKAQAPNLPIICANPGSASWRTRGMLTKIPCIEVEHFYPKLGQMGKKG